MVEIRTPYLQAKRRKSGRDAWYFCPPKAWRNAGVKGCRLPDRLRPAERTARYCRLVDEALARLTLHRAANGTGPRRRGELVTFADFAEDWRASADYAALARSTREVYGADLDRLVAMWGKLPPAAITRPVVQELSEKLSAKPARHNQVLSVVSRVLARAEAAGAIQAAPAIEWRAVGARDQIWREAEIRRLLEAVAGEAELEAEDREILAAYVDLLQFTGQRPVDVRKAPWSAWDGQRLAVRQQKTRAFVSVPALPELKARLEALPRRGPVILTRASGRAPGGDWLDLHLRRLRRAAELGHLQLRDFRRTAVVNLALAGCTEIEIAHITGHSLTDVRRILDKHYLPRQQAIADRAMAKLARFRKRAAKEQRPA